MACLCSKAAATRFSQFCAKSTCLLPQFSLWFCVMVRQSQLILTLSVMLFVTSTVLWKMYWCLTILSAGYGHGCAVSCRLHASVLSWSHAKNDSFMVERKKVSVKLCKLRSYIPDVFAQKPRRLEDVDRWKATELRQFALYTGKIVLKGILKEQLYEHFMTFSVALSILVCPKLARQYNSYAHELLTYFVAQGKHLYGEEFLLYNVHSMVHLASDECSAFSFENYLHQLKRQVRSGRSPLSQIVKQTK